MRQKSPLEITSSRNTPPAASLTHLYSWLGKERSELWTPAWLMPYPRHLMNWSPLFSLPQLLRSPYSLWVVYFSCRQLAPMVQSLQNLAQKRPRSHVTLRERQPLSSKGQIFNCEGRYGGSPKSTGKPRQRLTERENRRDCESAEVTGRCRERYFSYLNQLGEWLWQWTATTLRSCSQRFLSLSCFTTYL